MLIDNDCNYQSISYENFLPCGHDSRMLNIPHTFPLLNCNYSININAGSNLAHLISFKLKLFGLLA